MTDRRLSSEGVSRKRLLAIVMATTSMVAAAVVAVTVGVWKASSTHDTRLDVHQVDASPEDVRKSWTPERLQDAKQGDPMPNITKE
jgi:hypothetical protein